MKQPRDRKPTTSRWEPCKRVVVFVIFGFVFAHISSYTHFRPKQRQGSGHSSNRAVTVVEVCGRSVINIPVSHIGFLHYTMATDAKGVLRRRLRPRNDDQCFSQHDGANGKATEQRATPPPLLQVSELQVSLLCHVLDPLFFYEGNFAIAADVKWTN